MWKSSFIHTIFTSRQNYGITCDIPCPEKRDRTHPIMSIYPVPFWKSTYEGGTKIVLSCVLFVVALIQTTPKRRLNGTTE